MAGRRSRRWARRRGADLPLGAAPRGGEPGGHRRRPPGRIGVRGLRGGRRVRGDPARPRRRRRPGDQVRHQRRAGLGRRPGLRRHDRRAGGALRAAGGGRGSGRGWWRGRGHPPAVRCAPRDVRAPRTRSGRGPRCSLHRHGRRDHGWHDRLAGRRRRDREGSPGPAGPRRLHHHRIRVGGSGSWRGSRCRRAS